MLVSIRGDTPFADAITAPATSKCPVRAELRHPLKPSLGTVRCPKEKPIGLSRPKQVLKHMSCPNSDLNGEAMLSRVHYDAPSLQLGIRRPPWRPHGVSVEIEEASWVTKKS